MGRPRSRLADLGVVAAWGALGVAALGILTIRMRQVSVPAPLPKASSPGVKTVTETAQTEPAVSKPAKPAPPPGPPNAAPKRRIPVPSVATAPKPPMRPPVVVSPALVVPERKKTVVPKARPRGIATPVAKRPPSPSVRPAPKPVKVASRPGNEDTLRSAGPAWDSRQDTLGDPVPEPSPETSRSPAPPPPVRRSSSRPRRPAGKPAAVNSNRGAPGKAPYKPEVLLGRWSGNIWKWPATLNVNQSDGGSFSGRIVLKTDRGTRSFAVNGTFSALTGRITFWSPNSLPDTQNGAVDLGQESGRLITTDTMGGMGLSQNRRLFTWSFSR
ncbi:MAG: hypothetical protein H7Z41_02790 [Cytophagales bacterium]|nr:hypothetical protein [Armatimonadota bacterium]